MSADEIKINKIAEKKSNSDVSIIDIINMMLTFLWFIIILAVLVGGATYTYFKISSIPEYKSTAKLYVNT